MMHPEDRRIVILISLALGLLLLGGGILLVPFLMQGSVNHTIASNSTAELDRRYGLAPVIALVAPDPANPGRAITEADRAEAKRLLRKVPRPGLLMGPWEMQLDVQGDFEGTMFVSRSRTWLYSFALLRSDDYWTDP